MCLERMSLVLAAWACFCGAAWGQNQQVRATQLAQGKLGQIGNGMVVVNTDQGARTIALTRDTYVSLTGTMALKDLPPGVKLRLSGTLNPQTREISDWRLTYEPDNRVSSGTVTIAAANDWNVNYVGVLQSSSPLRFATVRGNAYFMRPAQSTAPAAGPNRQPVPMQPIRTPRPDLEGAVFVLDFAKAGQDGVMVRLRNAPQLAGPDAEVSVMGYDGLTPTATSVLIRRTTPFPSPGTSAGFTK